MRRLVIIALAAAGAYAAYRLVRNNDAARAFTDTVKAGMAQREAELRAGLGLDGADAFADGRASKG